MIADFKSDSVSETAAFSPSLNTVKPPDSNRFLHNGITYDNHPQHQFSIISAAPIPDFLRRDILKWLVGRKDFKKLIVHQTDLENYYYNCVFTNTDIIYVNGRCHGFRVTANFDSTYARGKPTFVTVSAGANQSVTIYNNSDIVDEYVYPLVTFRGSSVDIVNKTDDTGRHFKFSGLASGSTTVVDNEVKYITSSSSEPIAAAFEGKHWLRLRPGKNELSITAAGSVEIVCPCYVMMGF
jgi:phage-related protein